MDAKALNWERLLSPVRRKKEGAESKDPKTVSETRTEIERDHDRILFSTPVRRLADKMQVFPLDKNDSVRTRLTHSHEVSNLARSIGTALAFQHNIASEIPDSRRNIPALLAAIGLSHDLGNPPFGHQGESAIRSWFEQNQSSVLGALEDPQHRKDFLKWEGNAQGFRLVTRLQVLNDHFGLDLTYATLAAMMKYPTSSKDTGDSAATKKHGFFASEQDIAEKVLTKVGLGFGKRHPLAYVMEACDDIAYVVLDVEDAVKKSLASFSDVIAYLRHGGGADELIEAVIKQSCEKHDEYRSSKFALSAAELNDVSMQRFRVEAIGAMVRAATQTFVENENEFVNGTSTKGLMALSKGEKLRGLLKQFGYIHAYTHRSVLRVELQGYNVIHKLMDMFWAAIVHRRGAKDAGSIEHPFTRFVYGRISENYRRVFEHPAPELVGFPQLYRECLLLTDMISGMTDSFAMDLYREFEELRGDFDSKKAWEKVA